MHVAILVFPGVEEMDFIAPYEVFSAAAKLGGELTITLVSSDHAQDVTATHGLKFSATQSITQPDHFDLVIVPGGAWLSGENTGVRLAVQHERLIAWLVGQSERGSTLASVCTGSILLAAAGLLAGRPATTHHSAKADLAGFGASVVDARVVDDGNFVTAGGVTSGLDLSLWLVERFLGAEIARRVEDYLEYRRQGEVFLADRP